MIANDKDAVAALQNLHSNLTRTTERSTETIIKILSGNHKKIMAAAHDSILEIEQEVKELQNILIEQSKLILEMSNMKEPKYLNSISLTGKQKYTYFRVNKKSKICKIKIKIT
ncbi:hypothetical protein HZS_3890 [Henneguya salminicola]|nr:hypothetical protein HZS_3890 [Henneguya salminicola]